MLPAVDFVHECATRGVLGFDIAQNVVRFVTHYGITAADIQQALSVCQDVLAA